MKKMDIGDSAPAREKLLNASIKVFGLYGFEGASTRLLAREAGVNISAIPYYFESKDGLYRAVIEHISATARTNMQERAAKIHAALEDKNISEPECRILLHGFLEGLTRFLLSEKTSAYMGRIFIREQMDPTPAFDSLYENTMRPMHETITRLVARLTGLSGTQATLCAHALLGQVVIFKTHIEAAKRRLNWKVYGENEVAQVLGTIRTNTDMMIDSYQRQKRKSP